MSNITQEFIDDPAAFLQKYAVHVANVAEKVGPNKEGVRDVYFWKVSDSAASLKEPLIKGKLTVIKAYWLPWKTMDTVALDLKEEANYMFTSQMTGCRFSVLTGEGVPPKVAHIAGTLSKLKRKAEEDKLVKNMGGAEKVLTRRLSVSDVTDHGYGGQTATPSSAFVYGVRNAETKTWSFAAQIVGVNMLPDVKLGAVKGSDIKKPFVF